MLERSRNPVAAADASKGGTVYERLLREHEIDSSPAGLLEYLRRVRPSGAQRDVYRRLIEQLGSDDFAEREAASRELAGRPGLADALRDAAAGTDPEIRWRARQILQASNHATVLFAVLRRIEEWGETTSTDETAHPETVPALLAVVPYCDRPHLVAAVRGALRVWARPDDVPLLRRALSDTEPTVRATAALMLGAVAGQAAADDLLPLLGEPRQPDAVRLAAARALGDMGDRRALPALVDLLSSDELQVRLESASTLWQLTGQRIPFVPYADETARAAAVDEWRSWVDANGPTAPLEFPVKMAEWDESFLGGNRLVAFGYQNKVVELTAEGREVWTHAVKHAFSAEKLANGHVLIAAYGPNKVLEVDPDGQTVWECSVPSCLNARPFPNGNILVAGHIAKKVLELTRDKEVAWEFETSHNCYDAHRLPDGNTLLAVGQQAIEITPGGETTWSYRAKGSIYGIQPLPADTLLLTDTSRGVIEVTRDGRVVWEFAEANAFDAFRRPDGNTLISSNKRFIEVTPDGEVVWELAGGGYGRVRR